MSASSRFFYPNGPKFSSKKFLSKIKYWMEHHPIASNSFLCLNLWIAGDVLAQYSEHKLLHGDTNNEPKRKPNMLTSESEKDTTPQEHSSATIDYIRTVQCASYGAVVTGPLIAVWYPYLDRICNQNKHVVGRFFGGPLWGIPVAKVLCDEFLMDPPCLLLFFGYMNVCEGGSMETYKQKIASEFLTSWLTGLAVWPVVLLGTFRYLPIYAHAPLINACCIVWDGFLSHRNAKAKLKEREKRERASNEQTIPSSLQMATAPK